MLIPNNSPSFIKYEDNDPAPVWSELFGNNNPIALEIGCGVGDFIAQMAQIHPELNFIAIDFYNKGCLKTCKRIDSLRLKNVKVFRVEARSFVVACIPLNSLQTIIINCPDPWPKLRHRKRRLVQPSFVGWLRQYMRENASFYFSTDFVDYGEDVAAFMPNVLGFENLLAPDLFRHHLEGYPLSKYMIKFMSEGKKIYYIHYRAATLIEGEYVK